MCPVPPHTPNPPKTHKMFFFFGFHAMLSPFFHKTSKNSHSRTHFSYLGLFRRHYPLISLQLCASGMILTVGLDRGGQGFEKKFHVLQPYLHSP